ncbi:MAG TPA: phosphatase PAP2 family protein [Polyangiaceae bacterium]|nr:phosphatase PAP2 family protein [Polyangiaceae bacterium]
MTSDAEEEDLEWLFSNADEYAPTGLSGKPLDAAVLPQRGEGSRREWNASWRKFGLGNYALSGGSILLAVAATTIAPKAPRTTGRNDFDEWGRRTLSPRDYHSALWARDVSDVLVSVNIAFPLLIDSLVVTHWYRRSEEVAGQMALITSEVIAVTAALQTVTSSLAARERPYVRDCGTSLDPELEDCQESDRLRSFFSGHTSNAFAGAAVACSHHTTHDLFGDPMADGLACAALFLSAGTTGIMRVVGQRHYLTDVLTGATVGTLTGLGVPWLLHYGPLARRKGGPSGALHPSLHLVPMLNGLAVGGAF